MEQYERSWKNYYEILQVSPNAELRIIQAAYRQLAQTYHPDTNKNSDVSRKMTDINEAYETLYDSSKRIKYDILFKTKLGSREKESAEPNNEEIMLGAMKYVAEEAARGLNKSQIVDELTKNGWAYDLANDAVNRVFENKAEINRKDEILTDAMKYVAEEAARGINKSQIVDKLIKNGWATDLANDVVNRVFEHKAKIKRKEGGKQIGFGLLMLIIGGVITAATYSAASEGDTYIVTTGLFIVGGLTFIVGFFRWITS